MMSKYVKMMTSLPKIELSTNGLFSRGISVKAYDNSSMM